MKTKKANTYFEILFTVGLCLAIFERINLRLVLLPDFISGFLAGLALSLILGAGILKRKVSNNA